MQPDTSDERLISHVEEHDLGALFGLTTTQLLEGEVEQILEVDNPTVFPPDWRDLARLHRTVLARKSSTILEFGVGYSSIVLADGLRLNKNLYGDLPATLFRRNQAYELHSVDTSSIYIDITKRRTPTHLHEFVYFHQSDVEISTWEGRVCSFYNRLPQIVPDFIYVDGPDPLSAIGNVRNFTTAQPDAFPMSADLLAIEHFLMPGTLILIDGRTANARFINKNFQKEWLHTHDFKGDVHYLECVDPPLGEINQHYLEWIHQNHSTITK